MSLNFVETIEVASLTNIEASKTIEAVLNVLSVNSHPTIIDDHNGGRNALSYEGIMLFINDAGYTYLVPEMKASAFCLNPLYVGEDGNVHLSNFSCGGSVIDNMTPNTLGTRLARIQETYSPEFLEEFAEMV